MPNYQLPKSRIRYYYSKIVGDIQRVSLEISSHLMALRLMGLGHRHFDLGRTTTQSIHTIHPHNHTKSRQPAPSARPMARPGPASSCVAIESFGDSGDGGATCEVCNSREHLLLSWSRAVWGGAGLRRRSPAPPQNVRLHPEEPRLSSPRGAGQTLWVSRRNIPIFGTSWLVCRAVP